MSVETAIVSPLIISQQVFNNLNRPIDHNIMNDKIANQNKTLTRVTVPVNRIAYIDGIYYYEVTYVGLVCHIKLMPFEVKNLDWASKKNHLECVYQGLDETGIPILYQDKYSLIEELFEEDTVQKFYYISSDIDINSANHVEYHLVRDSYGLKHRLYAPLGEEQKERGHELTLYVKGINPKTKNLTLSLYNPNLDEKVKEWVSPDLVFEEIGETENKSMFFDVYLAEDSHHSKLVNDLVNQCQEKSNLWLITYMNILDTLTVKKLIRKHQIEELAIVCGIIIKLQEWMIEGSSFMEKFSDETKEITIQKAGYQIQKYQRLLMAIDLVRKGEQDKYISDIVSAVKKSGRIAINKEERLEVLSYILRIYPDFILQDLDSLSELIQALISLEEVEHDTVNVILSLLDYYIEYDVRRIRSSTYRTNDIDATQTLLISEILSLLCFEVMIYSHERYKDELNARTAKARFFRFLSFVCSEDLHPIILKAGIDALVGVIDDCNIFTWRNAVNMDIIKVSYLTSHAPVLESNLENDYLFVKETGKSGLLILDSTGFTIVPYKQCLSSFRLLPDITEHIKVIHHLESLPIKIGTMLDVDEVYMDDDMVNQYLLWRAIFKNPEPLVSTMRLQPPVIGDKVLVLVKKQNQSDNLKNLLFVTVVDKRYSSVDGVIPCHEISFKWIEDVRRLFKEGQSFYAKVIKSDGGRYAFSIKNDVTHFSSASSSVEDDVKNILAKSGVISDTPRIPEKFIQELILLIDMRIRQEINNRDRMALIGYAFCISALVSDPKSYYYDFLLRYYATLDKFINNSHKDVEIDFHNTIDDRFVGIGNKSHLVELLSYTDERHSDGLTTLAKIVGDESGNDVGKLSAMLLSYSYAMKAGLTQDAISSIKKNISDLLSHLDSLDLSSLAIHDSVEEVIDGIAEQEIDICEKVENTINEEVTADPCPAEPLKLCLFADNTYSIVAEDVTTPDSVLELRLPVFANGGSLLIVDNNGGVCRFDMKDLISLRNMADAQTRLNPYNISNYFVVPAECLIGLLITADDGKYMSIYKTSELPKSSLSEPNCKMLEGITLVRHQPFILPADCDIEDIQECVGKCVNRKDLSLSQITAMLTYGIYA